MKAFSPRRRCIFNPSSVLRTHPELLRARGDVFLLRPLGHPGLAALPVVEEAHHAATAGGFIISSQNFSKAPAVAS